MNVQTNYALFDKLRDVPDSSEEREFLTWYLGFLFKEFLVEYSSGNLCQVVCEFATHRHSPDEERYLQECIRLLYHNDNSTYNEILEVVAAVVEDE